MPVLHSDFFNTTVFVTIFISNDQTKLSSGELSAAPLKISIRQYLKRPIFSASKIDTNHLYLIMGTGERCARSSF